MNDELNRVIARLEELKAVCYREYKVEFEYITANQITDEARIEALFDHLWNFIDDDKFHALYWKLINYVERFDTGLGAYYRRIEEVYFEGY